MDRLALGQIGLRRRFRFFGEGREVTDYWEKMTNVRRRYMSVPSAAGAGLRVAGMAHGDELIQVEGVGVLGENKQRLQPADHWDWSIPNSQFTQGWKIGNLAFIGGKIRFGAIARLVEATMNDWVRSGNLSPLTSADDAIAVDHNARNKAATLLPQIAAKAS